MKTYQQMIRTNSSYRRERAINKLGGRCQCCGCTDIRGLQIVHINGGGAKETKHKGGNKIYDAIARGERLNEFRVLCMVCHSIETWKMVTALPGGVYELYY